MSKREMTMDRYSEIKRLLGLKIPVIKISETMRCTERTVRQIRDGQLDSPNVVKEIPGPVWMQNLDWQLILSEVLDGHPIKFIWAERAAESVGYKAFWEQFHKKFPYYKKATVVHREFAPGERAEVDYTGTLIPWINVSTGEIFEAQVFIGILGFSQKVFADASEDQKSQNFIASHVRMYESFKGVPKLTVPDCLKQGVSRTHLYDPDINKAYQAMAEHYETAIVPARPEHPKDKALVEGAVKLVIRAFRWRYRRHTFTSINEIRSALREVTNLINSKIHTRFKTSRDLAWENSERALLMPLPVVAYEPAVWKTVSVHPDSHVSADCAHYSVPHHLRGERVKAKLTESFVEIYFNLERVAKHLRDRSRTGRFITEPTHLPPNAQAYLEMTPQHILSQAKFLSADLHQLIDGMFNENALAHLRRSQGFVREARAEINKLGSLAARINIKTSIDTMKRFNKIRVPYFQDLLKKNRESAKAQSNGSRPNTNIERKPNNPMLRYTGGVAGTQLHLVTNENPTGENK
jgi:transposase